VRWEETVAILEEKIGYLVGDCLVASAFMSYMGPFLSNYRDELTKTKWLDEVSLANRWITPHCESKAMLAGVLYSIMIVSESKSFKLCTG